MSLDTAIQTVLAGASGLTNVVGTRIFRDKLPQDPTYPAVTYHLISAVPTHAMGVDAGLDISRVQVSCWATTAGGVEALATEVRTALSRFSGTPSPPGDVVIQHILVENEGPNLFESEVEIYHRPVDVMVARQT